LESLVVDGNVRNYAFGGETAAGFHDEPLATRDVDVFFSWTRTLARFWAVWSLSTRAWRAWSGRSSAKEDTAVFPVLGNLGVLLES
jgi:hypothetical protein